MSSINLMTTESRRRAILRSALRHWSKAGVLSLVSLTCLWTFDWWQAQKASTERDIVEQQYEPVQRLKAEIQTAKVQLNDLQTNESLAIAMATPRSTLSLFGCVSKAAGEADQSVHIQNLDFTGTDEIVFEGTTASQLKIRGIGRDAVAVTRFVDQLRAEDVFTKVELTSTSAMKLNDAVVREFHVECSLEGATQ